MASLSEIATGMNVGASAAGIVSNLINAYNTADSYEVQASNYRGQAAALGQEKQNYTRLFERDSRSLKADQTMAYIMSGLEFQSGDVINGYDMATSTNVIDSTSRERAADLSHIQSQYNTQIKTAQNAAAAAEKAAKNAKKGGIISTITSVAGTAAGLALFSDERLKENLIRIGTSRNGLPIYIGKYTKESGLNDGKTYLFLSAQDILAKFPSNKAVELDKTGYYKVNYAEALRLK